VCRRILLERQLVLQLVKKFTLLTKPEGSLPCLQELITAVSYLLSLMAVSGSRIYIYKQFEYTLHSEFIFYI
jgi:hypothetical protein